MAIIAGLNQGIATVFAAAPGGNKFMFCHCFLKKYVLVKIQFCGFSGKNVRADQIIIMVY